MERVLRRECYFYWLFIMAGIWKCLFDSSSVNAAEGLYTVTKYTDISVNINICFYNVFLYSVLRILKLSVMFRPQET